MVEGTHKMVKDRGLGRKALKRQGAWKLKASKDRGMGRKALKKKSALMLKTS